MILYCPGGELQEYPMFVVWDNNIEPECVVNSGMKKTRTGVYHGRYTWTKWQYVLIFRTRRR